MCVIIYIKIASYINLFLEKVADYYDNHKGGYMMAKLNDIKGYWDTSYGCDFNYNDMWEGKILLEEDGWFEGIVVDPNSFYKKDRFIFGVYYPNKVIELFKCTPIDVSAPFVFHGTRDVTGYDGTFESIGLLGSTPCGVSRIITRDAEFARENVDSEIDELKSSPIYETNLMSYLASSVELESYEELENQIILSFNNAIFDDFNDQNILEEVKYSISLSIQDTLNVREVIFKVDDKVIETFQAT